MDYTLLSAVARCTNSSGKAPGPYLAGAVVHSYCTLAIVLFSVFFHFVAVTIASL